MNVNAAKDRNLERNKKLFQKLVNFLAIDNREFQNIQLGNNSFVKQISTNKNFLKGKVCSVLLLLS